MCAERIVNAVRRECGYCRIEFCIIEVTGDEAAPYLQSKTTNDVTLLSSGQGQQSALLDRKGHLLSLFSLHRSGERFWLLASPDQTETIWEQLENYRFREKVEFKNLSGSVQFIALQGPKSESVVLAGMEKLAPLGGEFSWREDKIFGHDADILRLSLTGENGFVIGGSEALMGEVTDYCRAAGFVEISPAALEILQIEAGIPRFGVDVSSEHLMPETGLEQHAASYSKGCFPGQEVLARIKTYGAPRQALVGLIFQDDERKCYPVNQEMRIFSSPETSDCREVPKAGDSGVLKSSGFSPTLMKVISLAYGPREHRIPGKRVTVEIDGSIRQAEVTLLPFIDVTAPAARAKPLYESALKEFATGSETRAAEMLREVLAFDPLCADAYESLGVILARQGNLDEGIELMKRLASLDSESVMAHANLSMFYMEAGDKEKAEEEKAIAMGIQMSKIAREVSAKQKQKDEQEKLKSEAKGRMEMFQKVLELDSHDLLANYGLGDAHVQLGDYENAVPFLRKALEIKPSYTVAYLALGKAYENLGRTSDAREAYTAGVEVAARRGDLSPMNEMKSRLASLT